MRYADNPNATDQIRGNEATLTTRDPSTHQALNRTRRIAIIALSLVLTVAATIAVCVVGVRQSMDEHNRDQRATFAKAAFDWVELLLTIPDDPLTGNAQMEEMKRRTADPLNSGFEDTMAPYFQYYAPWSEQPLEIVSISLADGGTIAADHHASPSSVTVLLTTTAKNQLDRGHGLWADVVNKDGQYLVADFGAVT